MEGHQESGVVIWLRDHSQYKLGAYVGYNLICTYHDIRVYPKICWRINRLRTMSLYMFVYSTTPEKWLHENLLFCLDRLRSMIAALSSLVILLGTSSGFFNFGLGYFKVNHFYIT